MVRFLWYIVLLAAALVWCHADARMRDYRVGRLHMLALIFLPWLAFPYYLFASRGIRGFQALGLTLLALAASCLIAGLAAAAVGGRPYVRMLMEGN